MPSPVLDAVARNRAALERNDAAAIGRLVGAYGRMFKRVQGSIDALTMEIGQEQPSPGQAIKMARYKVLMDDLAAELNKFQALTIAETEAIARLGIDAASADALRLISISATGDTRLVARLSSLNPDAVETMLGFLAPDSPLYARLENLAGDTAQAVTDAMVDGIGLGHNPTKIARAISDDLGRGLTTAMRTVRTAQLWSYREATRANYMANDDILDGWIWFANLGPATCMSCIAQHGSLHPNTETLNDHYNGRCAMVPQVKGYPSAIEQMGEEWFNELSEEEQRKMMGGQRFEAWRDGKFSLDQLSKTSTDAVYGDMRVTTPLKELIGDK